MSEAGPLLEVKNLRKHYPITQGVLKNEVGRVRAVDGISFEVGRGETVGIVGESGCGKSTAATTLLRLEEPTLYDPEVLEQTTADVVPSGMGASLKKRLGLTDDLSDVPTGERDMLVDNRTQILFDGEDIVDYDKRELKRFRRRAQMIFQDPKSTFDPRMSIGDSLEEPLRVHGMNDRSRRREIVGDLLERVGLSADDVERFPHEFSGGQKQRIALARALVVNPDLIVADEPVSALDVSIQANILQLMQELQDEFGLSILFISHDMGVVQEICDRVAVMYLGEIVEMGPTEELFNDPKHPYTRALLSSIPTPNPRNRGLGTELIGDVPTASAPPQGCRFHTRCPEVIQPEEYDIDQQHWKHVMYFRDRVKRRQIDVEALQEAISLQNAEAGNVDAEGVGEEATPARLKEEIRNEFDLPEQLSDPGAARVLEAALNMVADGDLSGATQLMNDEFSTVCEREKPLLTELSRDHQAACHLNEGTRTESVSSTRAGVSGVDHSENDGSENRGPAEDVVAGTAGDEDGMGQWDDDSGNV